MRRTEKRSESPYNEANTTGPAVQGVYNYPTVKRVLDTLPQKLTSSLSRELEALGT